MSVFAGGVHAFIPRPRAPCCRRLGNSLRVHRPGVCAGREGTPAGLSGMCWGPDILSDGPPRGEPRSRAAPSGVRGPGQGYSQTSPSAQQQRQWGPAREPPAWGGACTPPGRLHLLSRMPPREAMHGAGGDPVPSRGPPGVRLCTGCEEPQGAPSQPCAVRPGERPKGTGPATSRGGCQDRGEGTSAHGAHGGHNHLEGRAGEVSPGLGPRHTQARPLQPPATQTHLGVLHPTSERAQSILSVAASPSLSTEPGPRRPPLGFSSPATPQTLVELSSTPPRKEALPQATAPMSSWDRFPPHPHPSWAQGSQVPVASQLEGGGIQPTALGRPCPCHGHQGHFSGLRLQPRPPSPCPELLDMNLGFPQVMGSRLQARPS